MLALIMLKVEHKTIQFCIVKSVNYCVLVTVCIEGVDLSTLMEDTKYLQLLAKVHQKAGRPENALEALTRAREKQSK